MNIKVIMGAVIGIVLSSGVALANGATVDHDADPKSIGDGNEDQAFTVTVENSGNGSKYGNVSSKTGSNKSNGNANYTRVQVEVNWPD